MLVGEIAGAEQRLSYLAPEDGRRTLHGAQVPQQWWRLRMAVTGPKRALARARPALQSSACTHVRCLRAPVGAVAAAEAVAFTTSAARLFERLVNDGHAAGAGSGSMQCTLACTRTVPSIL